VLTGCREWKDLIGFRRHRRETEATYVRSIDVLAACGDTLLRLGPVRKVRPLNDCLPTLGVRAQVARLITQTISAPHKLPWCTLLPLKILKNQ